MYLPIPCPPVLFIVDVQVKFDDFRQAVVATCGAKTVIITNPGTVYTYISVYACAVFIHYSPIMQDVGAFFSCKTGTVVWQNNEEGVK